MIFDGYVKDIKESFKNVFGKEAESIDDLNLVNVILFSALNSYYFEGNYKYTQIGLSENGKTTIAYLNNKKIEEEKLGINKIPFKKYFKEKNSKEFLNDLIEINDFPHQYSVFGNENENEKKLQKLNIDKLPEDCLKVINDLKNKEIYSLLFEDSKIKQELILKSKKDYEYTIISQVDIDDFLKEKFKIQDLEIEKIYSALNLNYDFRFFSKERAGSKLEESFLQDDKYFYSKMRESNKNFVIFAHNNYEIAGICPVNKNLNFENFVKSSDFFNVTSVMVASNARGNGIGIKLFEKAMEEASKRNICLVRTAATEQGQSYLKQNIDRLIKTNKVPVIDAEHVNHLYNPIGKILEKNKEKSMIKILDLLGEVKEQQAKTALMKSEAKSIDDVYAAEDAELAFFESLSNRKEGIKSLFRIKNN